MYSNEDPAQSKKYTLHFLKIKKNRHEGTNGGCQEDARMGIWTLGVTPGTS